MMERGAATWLSPMAWPNSWTATANRSMPCASGDVGASERGFCGPTGADWAPTAAPRGRQGPSVSPSYESLMVEVSSLFCAGHRDPKGPA